MTLNAEFISTLSANCWAFSWLALRGPLGLRKFVILRHDFFRSDSKLTELQNFSKLIVDSWFILVLISFCNLFMVDLV